MYHNRSRILQRIVELDTERRTILNKDTITRRIVEMDQARLVEIRSELQQLWHNRRCELAARRWREK